MSKPVPTHAEIDRVHFEAGAHPRGDDHPLGSAGSGRAPRDRMTTSCGVQPHPASPRSCACRRRTLSPESPTTSTTHGSPLATPQDHARVTHEPLANAMIFKTILLHLLIEDLYTTLITGRRDVVGGE
jgi:hypothetical protein